MIFGLKAFFSIFGFWRGCSIGGDSGFGIEISYLWNVRGGNVSYVLFGEVYLAQVVSVGAFTDERSITKWTLYSGVSGVARLVDGPGKREDGARV